MGPICGGTELWTLPVVIPGWDIFADCFSFVYCGVRIGRTTETWCWLSKCPVYLSLESVGCEAGDWGKACLQRAMVEIKVCVDSEEVEFT